ncbi:MAG TPA: hypothetical protein VJT32_15305 [bacterium]|nr:hypothetical protein [bacterium]
MGESGPVTLEQRLALVEGELRKANERIRAFEDWRRRTARVCVLMFGGVTTLLLVFGLVVPTPGQRNVATVRAPFVVSGATGNPLFGVDEAGGSAGVAIFGAQARLAFITGAKTRPAIALGLDGKRALLEIRNNAGQTVVILGAGILGDGGLGIESKSGALSVDAGTDSTGRGYVAAATGGVINPLGTIHGPKK